jgi:SAM-dependent methyltransferase
MIVEYLAGCGREIRSLLDIGCLNSYLHGALCARMKVDRYYGVDLIPESDAATTGMTYAMCDIDNQPIPFRDVAFDAIVCSEVIEHLFAPDRVFEFARDTLAPDGVLVVTTPNLAAWFNRLALLFGYQPCFSEVSVKHNVGKAWTNSRESVGGHLRMFTARALQELAACYGLVSVCERSTGGGPGIVGRITSLLSVFPALGNNLFFVFQRAGKKEGAP